jgi:hypothetical protein
LGVVSSPASLNISRPIRVLRARWRHSESRSAPRRARKDGPKVAPSGKVYGEWLAALVEEFGPEEVASWPGDTELPGEWDYSMWRVSRRM